MRARRYAGLARRKLKLGLDLGLAQLGRGDVGVFHEFAPAPSGGGNQFLRGLVAEFQRRGIAVERNRLSRGAVACLFNSYNFGFDRLRRFARPGVRMVHRVDGPIGVYRGEDDAIDRRIWALNQELADTTVFQSGYSLRRHLELGLEFRNPTVIMNTPDPRMFHPHGRSPLVAGEKVRLITTSWSANPGKGSEILQWLDEELDWSRFEFSFVGQTDATFRRIRAHPPVGSERLAELLRGHQVYVAPTRNDPCSNALLEGLACGLPALYLDSGGNGEIVGDAGLPFTRAEEVPAALDRLVDEWDERRARIAIPSLTSVADRYLAVLGLAEGTAAQETP